MYNNIISIKVLPFLSIDPCMTKECGCSRKCCVNADKEAVCGKVYSTLVLGFSVILIFGLVQI